MPLVWALQSDGAAYNKLGDVFADVEHITIGKFDATNNDVNYDGVDVQGFPTLYLFKSSPGLNGKKEVIAFDGKRTLKGMADFLQNMQINTKFQRKDLI